MGELTEIRPPMARALIGKGEGDVAEVDTPKGTRHMEILEVRYV
jgi:transcription elongation factor GreA